MNITEKLHYAVIGTYTLSADDARELVPAADPDEVEAAQSERDEALARVGSLEALNAELLAALEALADDVGKIRVDEGQPVTLLANLCESRAAIACTMNLLLHWRQRLRLSQPQMAAYIGVPKGTWIQWEHGRTEPPAVARRLFALLRDTETADPRLHASLVQGEAL